MNTINMIKIHFFLIILLVQVDSVASNLRNITLAIVFFKIMFFKSRITLSRFTPSSGCMRHKRSSNTVTCQYNHWKKNHTAMTILSSPLLDHQKRRNTEYYINLLFLSFLARTSRVLNPFMKTLENSLIQKCFVIIIKEFQLYCWQTSIGSLSHKSIYSYHTHTQLHAHKPCNGIMHVFMFKLYNNKPDGTTETISFPILLLAYHPPKINSALFFMFNLKAHARC